MILAINPIPALNIELSFIVNASILIVSNLSKICIITSPDLRHYIICNNTDLSCMTISLSDKLSNRQYSLSYQHLDGCKNLIILT